MRLAVCGHAVPGRSPQETARWKGHAALSQKTARPSQAAKLRAAGQARGEAIRVAAAARRKLARPHPRPCWAARAPSGPGPLSRYRQAGLGRAGSRRRAWKGGPSDHRSDAGAACAVRSGPSRPTRGRISRRTRARHGAFRPGRARPGRADTDVKAGPENRGRNVGAALPAAAAGWLQRLCRRHRRQGRTWRAREVGGWVGGWKQEFHAFAREQTRCQAIGGCRGVGVGVGVGGNGGGGWK